MVDELPAAGKFTTAEITRAMRAADACREAFAAGAPGGYWLAVALGTGRTDGCAYPSKAAAVGHQRGDRDYYAYLCLPHDAVVSWRDLAVFLRWASSKWAYWRSDPDLHLHVPKDPLVDPAGYGGEQQ